MEEYKITFKALKVYWKKHMLLFLLCMGVWLIAYYTHTWQTVSFASVLSVSWLYILTRDEDILNTKKSRKKKR